MQYSGGADSAAAAMKNKIYNARGNVDVTGTAYYVAENGTASASGTKSNPISIDKVNDLSLKSGDAVLFKRGDTFRVSSKINVVNGVTYAAYGTGNKPVILGSAKNYANAQWYQKSTNIWQTSLDASDVGVMVFDNGDSVGVKKDMESRLTKNGDYMNDIYWGVLFLYCDKGNPSTVYDSIELATVDNIFYGLDADTVTIDNLCLKYAYTHTVHFNASFPSGKSNNISVTNCEIGWGGGGNFISTGEQFGNGIEFFNGAENINVSDCYIYQQFDTGVTFQANGYVPFKNISITDNNIEYCAYSIEFFNGSTEYSSHVSEGYYTNINISGNILRFAGYGCGSDRPHAHGVAHICCWDELFTKSHSSFTISNNIFDCSANNLIYWHNKNTTANVTVSGNTFYQRTNPIDYMSLYHVDKAAAGYTANASLNIGSQQAVSGNTDAEKQASFTAQMALFEAGTTNAYWIN